MQPRGKKTRTQIMQAAISRFSDYGYVAASVDDICKDAGVSKGAFYHHFVSKQALFLALLDGWLQTVDLAIDASRDQTVPDTFLQMAKAYPYIFDSAGAEFTHVPRILASGQPR